MRTDGISESSNAPELLCRAYPSDCLFDGHDWTGGGTILRPAVCRVCGVQKCRECDEAVVPGSEGGFCSECEEDTEDVI